MKHLKRYNENLNSVDWATDEGEVRNIMIPVMDLGVDVSISKELIDGDMTDTYHPNLNTDKIGYYPGFVIKIVPSITDESDFDFKNELYRELAEAKDRLNDKFDKVKILHLGKYEDAKNPHFYEIYILDTNWKEDKWNLEVKSRDEFAKTFKLPKVTWGNLFVDRNGMAGSNLFLYYKKNDSNYGWCNCEISMRRSKVNEEIIKRYLNDKFPTLSLETDQLRGDSRRMGELSRGIIITYKGKK